MLEHELQFYLREKVYRANLTLSKCADSTDESPFILLSCVFVRSARHHQVYMPLYSE